MVTATPLRASVDSPGPEWRGLDAARKAGEWQRVRSGVPARIVAPGGSRRRGGTVGQRAISTAMCAPTTIRGEHAEWGRARAAVGGGRPCRLWTTTISVGRATAKPERNKKAGLGW